jgi:hypothetical protein
MQREISSSCERWLNRVFNRTSLAGAGILVVAAMAFAQAQETPNSTGKSIYVNSFESAAVDTVPDDFLVLDGAFAVKKESGNKFLELPGAPLDTYGVLFGPTESSGLAVTAQVQGTGKGRRYPAFAVGLNGVGGVKLQVTPAKKLLELSRADEVLTSAPYTWESGVWTTLRLQVRKIGKKEFVVEGKAWKKGAAEPDGWTITHKVAGDLVAGRASVWGNPFSGTPIRFDDLEIGPAK